MKRERIDFETFDKHFTQSPDGYFPVYSVFEEDYHGEYLRVLNLDMICEWRMDDGKVRFIEVPFETEEQYQKLIGYLRVAANLLNKAIVTRIDELEAEEPFASLKPESERIPFPDDGLPKLTDEEGEEIRKQVFQYEMSLISQALDRKGLRKAIDRKYNLK